MVYTPIPKPLEVYGYHGTSQKAAQEIIEQGLTLVSMIMIGWEREYTFSKMPLYEPMLGQKRDIQMLLL